MLLVGTYISPLWGSVVLHKQRLQLPYDSAPLAVPVRSSQPQACRWPWRSLKQMSGGQGSHSCASNMCTVSYTKMFSQICMKKLRQRRIDALLVSLIARESHKASGREL